MKASQYKPGIGRLPHLDGLRGIAIISVVSWHYFSVLTPAVAGTWQSNLKNFLTMSWTGVDLFFVISGFLITGILYDQFGTPDYFGTFYIRRAARILPLYLMLLAGYVFLPHLQVFKQPSFSPLLTPQLPFWCYATFTQNIMMGIRQVFGAGWVTVTWSLGPEEQFYVVIPCLLFLGGRAVLPYCLTFFLVLAPTLRFVSPGFHDLYNTPWRADGLAAGALLAWLMRRPGWFATVSQRPSWLLGLFALLSVGMGLMTYYSKDILGPFGMTVVASFYAVGLLVTLIESQARTRQFLSWKPLVWIGRRSYGIYLLHLPICGLIFGFFATAIMQTHPLGAFQILMASSIVGTIVLAQLSFWLLESPIVAWGHRFGYGVTGKSRGRSF